MTEKKSYRQMMKELPGEFEILTRFSLLKPSAKFNVIATAIADFMEDIKEDKFAEVHAILISTAEKRYAHAKVTLKEKTEACIICGEDFIHVGDEVPVCVFCLTGVRKSSNHG